MRLFRSITIFILPILITSHAFAQSAAPAQAPAPATKPDLDARVAVLRKAVEDTVDAFDQAASKKGSRFEARQLTQYAHYVMALGQPPAKAEAALRRVLASQDMDPKSPYFGEFPAVEGQPLAPPAGAQNSALSSAVTEVTVLPMVQTLIRYGDKLTPETRDKIVESLRAALPVIHKHQWSMDLANVYLQAAADELLIGEVLKDPKTISDANSRFTAFGGIARQRGIEEYTSPNFTAAQLNALLTAQNYTLQPDARTILDPLVRYMWSQVAANVVAARGTLGGPHSREVDFPFGMGSIDCYLYLEGLRATRPIVPPFSEGLRAYTNFLERAWRPDDAVRNLTVTPRVVLSRWGLAAGHDRYVYFTDAYAMGSAGATASVSDRSISFDFASPEALASVWVVSDFYDAPYGHVTLRDGSPVRPMHLAPAMAVVQEKSSLLALLNLRGDIRGQVIPSIATNICFPSSVDELRIDSKPVDCSKKFEMDVDAHSTMMIRTGPGALVVRLFDVDGIAGQKPVLKLKYDGNPWEVARLVAYQFNAPGGRRVALPDMPARVGVVFLAAEVHSDEELTALLQRAANMKLQSTLKDNAWRATLMDGATSLESGLDVETGAILTRKVNGQDFQTGVFMVNGKDLAGALLGF